MSLNWDSEDTDWFPCCIKAFTHFSCPTGRYLPNTKGQLTLCNLYHTVLLYYYAETKESLRIIEFEWGYNYRTIEL